LNRIREILERKGISQKDFAKAMNMNEGSLSRIINGKKEITLKTAQKISDTLGYGKDYIWPN